MPDNTAIAPIIQQKEGHPIQAPREITSEFQRFMIDTSDFSLMFYQMYCGWRAISEIEEKEILDVTVKRAKTIYPIDYSCRIMNEGGANFIRWSLEGLINHITATSSLNKELIYNKWNAMLISLEFALDDSVSFEGNPYHINENRLGYIIGQLTSFETHTYKAIDGFTTKEIMESILTSTQIQHGIETPQQKKGIIDRIFGGLK